jgi:hypothetical protein
VAPLQPLIIGGSVPGCAPQAGSSSMSSFADVVRIKGKVPMDVSAPSSSQELVVTSSFRVDARRSAPPPPPAPPVASSEESER